MNEIPKKLLRIPMFAGKPVSAFTFKRIGGLTNLNHKVLVDGNSYMLRIAGEGTGEYIDRKAEEINARIASEAGVNAEVLFFETEEGIQLTSYIDGSVTMDQERFRDLDSVSLAASAFRKVHTCGKLFANEFNIFSMMDKYLELLNRKNAPIRDGYAEVQGEAGIVRTALYERPAPLVPCHCDPLAENFLDTGEHMYIVDWEYAGNNDPMWDLGDLSVEAGFSQEQDAALMAAYFEGEPPAEQVGRMMMYKAMCDLLWTLWGVIQVVNDNPAEDFWAYAVDRLERCRILMESSEFSHYLDAVKKGESK